MKRRTRLVLTDADWCEAVSLCLLERDARFSGSDIHRLAVDLAARPACRVLTPQAAADWILREGAVALGLDGKAGLTAVARPR